MIHLSINLSRILLKIFYIFPVKRNQIFFSSYEGKQFSCNPKYIFNELSKTKQDLLYVYEYNDLLNPPDALKENVTLVKHNSFKYFYHVLTSRVIITNSGITAKIPIRNSQTLINTWHGGGAYKKAGKDIAAEINGSDSYFIDIQNKQTSFFISSSRRFSEIIHSGIGIDYEKFLNIGMPRNDIFFQDQETLLNVRERVKNALGIDKDEKFILYAPTFRGNAGQDSGIKGEKLDIDGVLQALHKKFGGKWHFVYRGHYFSDGSWNELCINATKFPDMQELLVAADILITDYSSSVWDFSITDKPGFLYTPDIDLYKEERDFYIPIDLWPYHVAKTNQDLQKVILSYNHEEQVKRNLRHHEMLGSYEMGNACQRIASFLLNII